MRQTCEFPTLENMRLRVSRPGQSVRWVSASDWSSLISLAYDSSCERLPLGAFVERVFVDLCQGVADDICDLVEGKH